MKIFEKQWALTLLLLPFFKLPFFEHIPSLSFVDSIFDICKIVSAAVIVVSYLNGRKISRIIICIILFELSLFFSTFINNGNYWSQAVNCGTVVSFCMITELAVKKNSRVYFKTVLSIFIPLSIINLLTVFIVPQGLSADSYYGNVYYIIGSRNGLPPVLIPLMVYSFIYSSLSSRKFTVPVLLFTVIVSATILKTWSATGVAGWFIFIAFVILFYRTRLSQLFNSLNLSLIYIAAFFFIIVFRLQTLFSFIIEDMLHKSITFTGRTDIWDIAILLIKRSPLTGYGVYEGHGFIFVRGLYYYSHNVILEVLLQGGVVSLVFYIAIFFTAMANLYRLRQYPVSQLIAFGIFTVFVMMLMEAYFNIWIFALAVIASCAADIAEQTSDSSVGVIEEKGIPLRSRYIYYRLRNR
ncbi:MAG: O-antigen ligase family protein [Oscillospiraceae bacterium]|nr:O-antigen ligase family protein [Oscillospiraceae bacterium]